jgi:cytochrome c-type biogenesis protein CcmH
MMNLVLFFAALLMTVTAMAFVAQPLIVSVRRRNSGSAKLSLLAVIVVFGFGIVLYGVIGKPQFSNVQAPSSSGAASMQPSQQGQQSSKIGSVTSLLAGLEARLQENPDDAKGWLLLAKSYDHLGRSAEASEAYEKAAALGMTDATLESRLGATNSTEAPASTSGEIRGSVSVADTVAASVEASDTVYVVAKSEGNPMPLAVLRRSATELPFDFVLSDANSMVQGAGISDAGKVIVSARLSKVGDALNAPAKFGASSVAIDPDSAGDLHLVIDVVPGS